MSERIDAALEALTDVAVDDPSPVVRAEAVDALISMVRAKVHAEAAQAAIEHSSRAQAHARAAAEAASTARERRGA